MRSEANHSYLSPISSLTVSSLQKMKLITYYNPKEEVEQLAILVDGLAYDMHRLHKDLPDNMTEFLWGEDKSMVLAKAFDAKIKAGEKVRAIGIPVDKLFLMSPVIQPTSCRDAYTFRQHVATARQNRGLEMIPAFDEFPVFYFTNHSAIQGPGDIECMPDHLQKLDFELEIAIVIGKQGRNIRAENAEEYIAGFLIMNDISARQLQLEEMKLNLGPAKGKDFCTVLGPHLLTPDELISYQKPAKEGHTGVTYDLEMKCWVNGELVSTGNVAEMTWTFAEIIERCSYGTDLLPGDVIGSGTVGTGCFLELNGTAKRDNPKAKAQWLQAGDVIDMEITQLGRLSNTIVLSEDNFSILARKKRVK